MNVKMEHGKITLSVQEILESLTKEEIRELADQLSCMEYILEDVTSQIVSGWTDRMSHGLMRCSSSGSMSALDKAINEITIHAGDVASAHLKRLQRELESQQKQKKVTEEWAWSMYHSWGKTPNPPMHPNLLPKRDGDDT